MTRTMLRQTQRRNLAADAVRLFATALPICTAILLGLGL